MGKVKDLWFAEMERLQDAYLDAGLDPDRAYELACETAHRAAYSNLVDRADAMRKRAKETDEWLF